MKSDYAYAAHHFKLYLGNWNTNCFEICFVARSKVAIKISGR